MKEELVGLGVPCDQVGTNIVDDETGTVRTAWSTVESDALQDPEPHPEIQAAGNARLIEHWRKTEEWSRKRSESGDNPSLVGWVVDVPFQYGTLAMNRGRIDPEAGEFAEDEIEILGGFAEVVSLGYTRFLDFQNLEKANKEIQEANRLKSEFLASMSHDLRTPVNAIIGHTRILLRRSKDALDERSFRNLDNIRVSADNLLILINDILDLSRIEAGRVDISPEDVDLGQLVRDCVTSVRPLVKSDVELLKRVDEAKVNTDSVRLRRVVMNLLSNAVKFTDQGSITVSLRQDGDGVELAVADTGHGIPAEDLPHIFDEFRQVDRDGAEKEGTGLGLSIARKSVELLGGTLTAVSEVGVGTTFTVRIGDYPEPMT